MLPSLGPAEGESAAGASGGVYVKERPSARTWLGLGLGLGFGFGLGLGLGLGFGLGFGLGLGVGVGLGLANPNPDNARPGRRQWGGLLRAMGGAYVVRVSARLRVS